MGDFSCQSNHKSISLLLSCLLHISWTLWVIVIELPSNNPLNKIVCVLPLIQLPSLKVIGFTLEFCFCSISPEPLELFSLDFTQILPSSRWFAELMTWQIDLRSKSYFKVLGFTLQFGVGSLYPLWMIFIKLHPNVLLSAWISYPYWRSHFKVKRFCWRSFSYLPDCCLDN